jgi:hypothetical protein
MTYGNKIIVLRYVAPCSPIKFYWRYKGACCLHSPSSKCPDDGGSKHLWNVGKLSDYMTQHTVRQSSLYSPTWKSEISHTSINSRNLALLHLSTFKPCFADILFQQESNWWHAEALDVAISNCTSFNCFDSRSKWVCFPGAQLSSTHFEKTSAVSHTITVDMNDWRHDLYCCVPHIDTRPPFFFSHYKRTLHFLSLSIWKHSNHSKTHGNMRLSVNESLFRGQHIWHACLTGNL